MSYNRKTELRNVQTKDLYKLAVILDDDNYWQILMEIIPKDINNETFGTDEDLEKISSGAPYERKYNNDQIRLIENAIRRPGESRLYSQILFDEWGSSGRKHERPTLGVLLHLLVQSKLFRAADFVAELLNEPNPPRPSNGPAAEFEFELDVFNDIQETVNDTRFYPNTEDLQENITVDINKDYYTKYHNNDDKKLWKINKDTEDPLSTAPKPPPRLLKSARLLKQQQKQQQMAQQQETKQLPLQSADTINNQTTNNEGILSLSTNFSNNMPNLSALMHTPSSEITSTATTTTNFTTDSEKVLPKLSTLNNYSARISQPYDEEDYDNSTPSLIYTKSNIMPEENYHQSHPDLKSIPLLVFSKPLNTDCRIEEHKPDNDLPVISALNLNGERDELVSRKVEQQQDNNLENVTSSVLNFSGPQREILNECASNNDDLKISSMVANMNYNEHLSKHQLEDIEENYNGSEHENDIDNEVDLDDDDDSIPNLSFLENRSYNNESSLTSVTNTSGDNSFEQSANDYSSTSTDNVPCLSVLNQ